MDEIVLPFTMRATVTHGGPPPEPLPDVLPPGWVKIPITMQIRLSGAMADPLPGRSGPGPGGRPGLRQHTELDADGFRPRRFRRIHAGRGRFDALPDPEPEPRPTLEHVADRLPVQPQVAPPGSTSGRADRPGSGLSALHAAQFGVAPAPPPGQAARKPVKTEQSAPVETLDERNIRELAAPIWTEARGVGDKAMTAVG